MHFFLAAAALSYSRTHLKIIDVRIGFYFSTNKSIQKLLLLLPLPLLSEFALSLLSMAKITEGTKNAMKQRVK